MSDQPADKTCATCGCSIQGTWISIRRDAVETMICLDCNMIQEYCESGIIITSLWLKALLAVHRGEASPVYQEIESAMTVVNGIAKDVERDVWFGGVQAFVRAAPMKGYRADVDGMVVMSYTLCGRSLLQVEQPDGQFICCIYDEESETPRGGIQGIHARPEVAISLLQWLQTAWKTGSINLVHSPNVGI